MVRPTLVAVLALAASSCSCQISLACAAGTCGILCKTCEPGAICAGGECRQPCTPQNCSGCCNPYEDCVSGDEQHHICGWSVFDGRKCQACDAGPGVATIGECGTDAGTATTAELQASVIGARCGAMCHYFGGPATAYGDLTDATLTQLWVGRRSAFARSSGELKVVDPGSPSNSSLWLMVSAPSEAGLEGPRGEPTGPREPRGGAPLSAAELWHVRAWICSGAPP